jgi:hypothetical protein
MSEDVVELLAAYVTHANDDKFSELRKDLEVLVEKYGIDDIVNLPGVAVADYLMHVIDDYIESMSSFDNAERLDHPIDSATASS